MWKWSVFLYGTSLFLVVSVGSISVSFLLYPPNVRFSPDKLFWPIGAVPKGRPRGNVGRWSKRGWTQGGQGYIGGQVDKGRPHFPKNWPDFLNTYLSMIFNLVRSFPESSCIALVYAEILGVNFRIKKYRRNQSDVSASPHRYVALVRAHLKYLQSKSRSLWYIITPLGV